MSCAPVNIGNKELRSVGVGRCRLVISIKIDGFNRFLRSPFSKTFINRRARSQSFGNLHRNRTARSSETETRRSPGIFGNKVRAVTPNEEFLVRRAGSGNRLRGFETGGFGVSVGHDVTQSTSLIANMAESSEDTASLYLGPGWIHNAPRALIPP